MSNYFKNFPVVDYRFGNNELPVQFQHLGTYIDIIDQVKEYSMFYESYFIPNGMRPDQVSSVLYGTPNNYWTFWLLNESLRISGWPLKDQDVYSKAKEYYPNISLTTNGVVFTKETNVIPLCSDQWFKVGNYIYSDETKDVGKILKIEQELGIITTDMKLDIRHPDSVVVIDEYSALKILSNPTEDLKPLNRYSKIDIIKVQEQFDAPHHYEDFTTKEWMYPAIISSPPGFFINQKSVNEKQSISNYERLLEINSEQKIISVIKSDVINTIVTEFNTLLKEVK